MDEFAAALTGLLASDPCRLHAWCVLPNHYHALIETADILWVLGQLGKLHGRSSHAWNGEDGTRGRKVFHRSMERTMRSDRHFWATMNYVHHNPVHHGYVGRWIEWPWSSAREYLERTDPEEARRIWHEHPIDRYGAGWDNPGI